MACSDIQRNEAVTVRMLFPTQKPMKIGRLPPTASQNLITVLFNEGDGRRGRVTKLLSPRFLTPYQSQTVSGAAPT